MLPLARRCVGARHPAPVLRAVPPAAPTGCWAEQEFGQVDFTDARLRPRLIQLAEAFGAHPAATLATALNGAPHQVKAAYRLFHNPQVDLQTLLHLHYDATAARIRAQPLVLVARDTTSINCDAHAATTGLGPINTRLDGAQGLKLHDRLQAHPCRCRGVPDRLDRPAGRTDYIARRSSRSSNSSRSSGLVR